MMIAVLLRLRRFEHLIIIRANYSLLLCLRFILCVYSATHTHTHTTHCVTVYILYIYARTAETKSTTKEALGQNAQIIIRINLFFLAVLFAGVG